MQKRIAKFSDYQRKTALFGNFTYSDIRNPAFSAPLGHLHSIIYKAREKDFSPIASWTLDCCPMHTTSSLVARTIAQTPEQFIVFSQCAFRFKDSNMVVDTPSEEALDGVRSHLGALTRFAIGMDAKKILLSLKGIVQNPPLDVKSLAIWSQHQQPAGVPLLPRLGDDRAIVIARMSDHKILCCTSELGRIEKVKPNDLIGDSLLKFNIPEVLDKYISDLLHHQFLDAYEMSVLDGLGNKKDQVVRAWLTQMNGEIVRVVQVLEDKPF